MPRAVNPKAHREAPGSLKIEAVLKTCDLKGVWNSILYTSITYEKNLDNDIEVFFSYATAMTSALFVKLHFTGLLRRFPGEK